MSLSAVQERSLALLLAIVLLLAMVFFLAWPAVAHIASLSQEVEQTQDHIHRYQRIAMLADENKELLQQWQRQGGIKRYLLDERTAGVAAARLQDRVKRIISGQGGRVTSIQSLKGEDESGLQRVAINVRMQASINNMSEVFMAIENYRPLLFIEEVKAVRMNQRRGRSRAQQNQAVQLDMSFRVVGYMLSRQTAGDSL